MSTTTSWGSLGHSYNYQLHPFTAAQWKELERQAMIYKYIVASVPVPPDLLFSVSEHPSYAYAPSYASWGKLGGILNLRWGNLRDGEPGRCKRTDGKKWRCSRDVAPNQKYCERHLHRGRPRSRKPVEVRADFPINFNPGNNHHQQHCPKNAAKKTRLGGGVEVGEALSQHNQDSSHFNPKFDMNAAVASSQCMEPPVQAFKIGDTGDLCYKPIMPTTPYGKNRSLHWGIKGEENPMAATSGCQYWQPMGQTDMTLTIDGSPSNTSPCILGQNSGHDGPMNLNFSADFYPVNNNPKSFIDAFSDAVSVKNDISGERSKCPVSSMIRSSPYSLALSMGGCNDDHCPNSCEIQMGLAVPVSEFHSRDGPGQRSQTSSWLNSGLSWASSAPTLGGPLAEVLLPRVVASDPSCSDPGDRDLTTPPATTVSSPSGVLQRTLVSFSDSSGSNSPTWDSRKTKLGTPFHWLS